jgi:hypothetical protein
MKDMSWPSSNDRHRRRPPPKTAGRGIEIRKATVEQIEINRIRTGCMCVRVYPGVAIGDNQRSWN